MIARFNPASIKKKPRYMVQNLVPDSDSTKKAASAAAIVAGVPAAREVALKNLGSGAEAAYPMQPDVYGGQDTDASSPGPTQITDPNAPQNIPSQRESTPEVGIERQAIIANQKRGARYDPDSIMGFVSSLVGNPKANEAFDPSKAIGGANVPYQEAKGLQRFFGNQANQLNLGAQQAQGAKWEAEADEQQKEDRLLKRIREADKPTQARFEATQKAAEIAEANRVTAENERLKLEGQRLGLTKQQIEDARLDRVARLQAEKEERDIRIENMRTQNAINDAEFGLRSRVAGRRNTQVIPGKDGGYSIFDIDKGEPIGSYSPGGLGMVRKDPNDPNSPMIPGTTPGGWEPYVPPVTIPKDLPDSPQVDRTTGAAPGGPRKDTMGGKLPPPEVTPMRAAAPSPLASRTMTEQFKSAMPSLNVERQAGPGVTSPFLSEDELAQQAMSQIAYPLRAAVGQQVKSQYENPEVAAMTIEGRMPFTRFKRPSAEEQEQALSIGNLIRKMYAE
jgi:hypothetical protein